MKLLLIGLLLAGTSVHAKQKYNPGQYSVDPAHSKVGFEIAHLVISSVEGRFTDFEGSVELAEKFEKSKVSASASIKSVDTGMPKRDEHLRSADFFDAEKFPKMSFKSSKIEGSPEKFKLTGELTIKGITKKVTFEGKFLGLAADGYGNEKAAFEVETKISRKEFGLTWNNMVEAGPVVGDEVEIELKIQAGRPIAKK
jgi:polyisoprenoid-binding protein YceI